VGHFSRRSVHAPTRLLRAWHRTSPFARAIVRGTAASPLLGPLLDEWPDVFHMEMLEEMAKLHRLHPARARVLEVRRGGGIGGGARVRGGPRRGVARTAQDHVISRVRQAAGYGPGRTGARGRRWFARLAAKGGRLEALQWAREHSCPWDWWTCAALGGHLEVLRWARENDCPWDSNTCSEIRCGRALGGVAVGAAA